MARAFVSQPIREFPAAAAPFGLYLETSWKPAETRIKRTQRMDRKPRLWPYLYLTLSVNEP